MKNKKYIYDKIKKLTTEKFDEDSLVYEIGVDSLDLVELITEIEEEKGISINDDDLEKIQTIGDVLKAYENASK